VRVNGEGRGRGTSLRMRRVEGLSPLPFVRLPWGLAEGRRERPQDRPPNPTSPNEQTNMTHQRSFLATLCRASPLGARGEVDKKDLQNSAPNPRATNMRTRCVEGLSLLPLVGLPAGGAQRRVDGQDLKQPRPVRMLSLRSFLATSWLASGEASHKG